MRARLSTIAILICLALAPLSTASAQKATTGRSTVTTPFVTGSFLDAANGQGVFSGNLMLEPFELRDGHVVAVGRLKGGLSDSTGELLGRVDQKISWPVESVEGTCAVLRLKLASTEVRLLDTSVRFEPLELDVAAATERSKRARSLICSVSEMAKSASGDLTARLNELFRTLR